MWGSTLHGFSSFNRSGIHHARGRRRHGGVLVLDPEFLLPRVYIGRNILRSFRARLTRRIRFTGSCRSSPAATEEYRPLSSPRVLPGE